MNRKHPENVEFVTTTVSIRRDQKEFIHCHPEYNFSGLFRKTIDELIAKSQEVTL